MGYREAIKRGMGYKESEVKDTCVNILTEKEEYPLSFIRFETRDLLGIDYTRPDGKEGFVVLNKKYVTSIAIVYDGDITIDVFEKDNSHEVSYN